MFTGISTEMMANVREGKSPLCAIQSRLEHGKRMAYDMGKRYGLIPPDAMESDYMRDDHRFWNEEFYA